VSLDTLVIVIAVVAVVVVWAVLQLAGAGLSKQKETIARASKTGLEDMFIFVDSTKLFYYNVALLVVVPIVVWFFTDNPVLAVASAVIVVIIPKYAVSWLRKRRFTTFERQLPDALLMISGAMRAGASLTVAMEGMVKESRPPLSQEFELMLREQRLGVDFDTALKNMEKRLPIQDFIMVISGMRISREVGGNLADILESLADTLRRKHQMEGKINSLTSQGKMQGLVMTCLPLFLMLVLTKMEPAAMYPLWHSMLGWVVLGIIAVMEVIGYLAIRKITNIDV
jgi:tight adherence protein B